MGDIKHLHKHKQDSIL